VELTLRDIVYLLAPTSQVFGVDNVKVLQGGLEAWKDGGYDMVVEKREVEESGNSTSHAAFGAKSLTFRRDLLYTKDEMLATLPSEGEYRGHFLLYTVSIHCQRFCSIDMSSLVFILIPVIRTRV
tara:strand:+ start:550 stop:924 length:375 start_codon:yes stop_codon:yes gene_type:complete